MAIMPRQLFLFDRPRRFVTGTVGEPGDRTFYLQAADSARVVSVSLDKQQVVVLADRIEQLLDEVVARTGTALPASGDPDAEALEQPIDEEFRVSAMALAWDSDSRVVIIEAQAPVEDAEIAQETLLEDVDDGPDALRVRLEPGSARDFVDRARRVLAAGRPPCPLCGLPLDPGAGHVCPRQNGYHRRTPLDP
jgi:uncharacterized repeat protein (TIGR03847 family)